MENSISTLRKAHLVSIRILSTRGNEIKEGWSKINLRAKLILLATIIASFIFIFMLITNAGDIPQTEEWFLAFRPATLELLAGRSPYNIPSFYNPPWALLPLVPFALLPIHVGFILSVLLGLCAYVFVAIKRGIKPIALFIFLISPFVLYGLANGNLDWMVLLGCLLPPQVGLFFIMVKPQAGVALALYWLIVSWQKGGLKETFKVFLPVTTGFLLSFLFYGFWPFRATELLNAEWNMSMWPMSVPIGLLILWSAIKEKRIWKFLPVTPLLSPYVAPYSWTLPLFAFLESTPQMLIIVVSSWIISLFYWFK